MALVDTFTTPHLADACVRLNIALRCGPSGLTPVVGGGRATGRALPVRHVGSVDVFLEAFEGAAGGEVLVVDNGGRLDEGCIGDLVAREAQLAGLAGIVIWGAHRDSREIADIGLPLFSLGAVLSGPQRLDPRPADAFESARCGSHAVTVGDLVIADGDGVLFVPAAQFSEIAAVAATIRETERQQALAMIAGRSLREQLRFREYLARRGQEPAYTFRQHLRDIKGAIEE